MNIKLKAFLIAISIIVGVFGSVYTMIMFPEIMLIIFGIGLLYAMYRLVLNILEQKEKR